MVEAVLLAAILAMVLLVALVKTTLDGVVAVALAHQQMELQLVGLVALAVLEQHLQSRVLL
jgi:hypothetical protein